MREYYFLIFALSSILLGYNSHVKQVAYNTNHSHSSSFNERPEAVNDTVSTLENETIGIDVLSNDSDPDGDPIFSYDVSQPKHGTIFIPFGDSIFYTPNPSYAGQDSFQYAACDPPFSCSIAWVYITVIEVNDAPVAVDDNVSTDEDVALDIEVLINDTDDENDTLTVQLLTGPVNGAVTLSSDVFNYLPDSNYTGLDSLQYIICDPEPLCDTAWVIITVNPVNDPPDPSPDSLTVVEDTMNVEILPLVNDSDPDGDTLSISSAISISTTSTISIVDDTILNYTPPPNFFGQDTIIYQACDQSSCTADTIIITVLPVNDAPIAFEDFNTTEEDTAIDFNVTLNDQELDNDPLTLQIIGGPSNGTATQLGNTINYLPDTNFVGTDSLRYVICDPSMLCDTTWALILVTPVNDPPQPEKDILSVEEDTVNAEIIPLANDSDPDGDDLFIGNVTLASGGTINVVDSTFIYYSPPADYFGADTILYESCDSFTCVLDTICITVTPVNDAPNAIDDTDVIAEDSISKIAFLENDSDIEDDELTYQIITDPVAGTYSIVNDTLTYVPNENYNGADSLEYVICDQEPLCDTAWITITISEVNDPPSGYNPPGNPPGDLSICVNEDTTNVEILPISGGSEVDGDQLFIATYTLPISGGTAILQGDTMIIYTPPADYFGQDTIFIDVCDNLGLCVMDTIPITVKPVVDPVIAVDDMVSVLENDSTIIDAISNDQNPDGGMLSITIISNPTNGIASIDANQIKYVPTSDYHGQDSLVYEVCNTFGQCDMAVVYITVEFVNESPIAFDDNVTITDTSCVTIPVLINDSDPDNDTLIVSIIPTGNNSISVDENGAIEYCPPANYFLTDTIYYMVCDTHAVPLCDTAIVVITMSCNSFSHILTHNAFCPNEPFNIAGAEIRDLTSYEWSYPDVLGIISTDPELIDFMISEPSDFILKSTRFGCEPQFDTIHVEVRQEVSTPDVVDEILECEDASVTLSVTSPDPTLNYQWYKVPGTVPIASGADIVIPILNDRTEGEYYVIANDGSCDSEPSINLNLQIQTDLTPPAIEAGDDQNSCENKSVLGATPSMNNQAMWYTNGTSFIVDPNDPNSRVFDLVIGENKFYWEQTNSSCIDNSLDSVIITYAPEPDVVQDSFFITTNELVSLDLLENDALYGLAYSINFQSLPLFIADHGDGSISLEVTKDMPNPIFFNYEVCFDACPQNCSNAQVSIHYESIDIGKVPNVFTPNGDGINDLFVINNINQYPENKLVIFNRWGDQVYAKKGYDNSWDGNFKDAPLAVGTYFYIFELGDENQTIETGFIHLDR